MHVILPKNSPANWQNIQNDGTIDTFAKVNFLNSNSLQISGEGVIILPNNTILEVSKDSNMFVQITKEVYTALNDGGVNSYYYDDGRDKRELILDSSDIVLPILFFIGKAATSIGLKILSSWIYNRWIKPDEKQPPTIKVEYVEIEKEGSVSRWRFVEGSALEVKELLLKESRLLSNNNLSEEEISLSGKNEINSELSWWDSHRKNSAETALHEANQLVKTAEEFMKSDKNLQSESFLRQSLSKAREAVLWEPENLAHIKNLHEVGRKVHDMFGCQITFKEEKYWVDCPVMLSHSKGGFSIGASGKAICSICNKDIFNCSHVKGKIYDGVLTNKSHEICNICSEKECIHVEGEVHDGVRAFAIVTEWLLDHISLVENPANPLCVVQEYSVSKSEFLAELPKDEVNRVVYGETIIQCNHCTTCNGT